MMAAMAPGYVFCIFCGMMVLQLVWVKTLVPETKGVPLEQILRLAEAVASAVIMGNSFRGGPQITNEAGEPEFGCDWTSTTHLASGGHADTGTHCGPVQRFCTGDVVADREEELLHDAHHRTSVLEDGHDLRNGLGGERGDRAGDRAGADSRGGGYSL